MLEIELKGDMDKKIEFGWTDVLAAICSPTCNLPQVGTREEIERNAAIAAYWNTPIGKFNRAYLSVLFPVKARLRLWRLQTEPVVKNALKTIYTAIADKLRLS